MIMFRIITIMMMVVMTMRMMVVMIKMKMMMGTKAGRRELHCNAL